MPAYDWAALVADLDTVVVATWPEIVANGFWDSDHIQRETWEQRTFPFAVYDLGDPAEGNWGLVNCGYELEVQIHYLAAESTAVEGVRAKLESLSGALYAATLSTSGFSILDTRVLWSDRNPVNALLYVKNIPFVGGTLQILGTCGKTRS